MSGMSGILGLGYQSISFDDLPTFVNSAHSTDKSFTFYLHSSNKQSYMYAPGFDPSQNSKWQFHNVAEKKYWSLQLDSISQGSKKIDASKYLAAIDSGTSTIVGPKSIISKIIQGISVNRDCSNLASLPSITFTFNKIDYTLTADEYVI